MINLKELVVQYNNIKLNIYELHKKLNEIDNALFDIVESMLKNYKNIKWTSDKENKIFTIKVNNSNIKFMIIENCNLKFLTFDGLKSDIIYELLPTNYYDKSECIINIISFNNFLSNIDIYNR